ncbi:hypothetical protein, partial [Corynebacterium sp.]|uniref:hypothetical protein n=1 Tax=Corynebacterium sp. TaxID=1720 RepID=UPI0026DC665B
TQQFTATPNTTNTNVAKGNTTEYYATPRQRFERLASFKALAGLLLPAVHAAGANYAALFSMAPMVTSDIL